MPGVCPHLLPLVHRLSNTPGCTASIVFFILAHAIPQFAYLISPPELPPGDVSTNGQTLGQSKLIPMDMATARWGGVEGVRCPQWQRRSTRVYYLRVVRAQVVCNKRPSLPQSHRPSPSLPPPGHRIRSGKCNRITLCLLFPGGGGGWCQLHLPSSFHASKSPQLQQPPGIV